MFFHKKITPVEPIQSVVRVDRQSVCMGDDCTAPNEKVMQVSQTDTLLSMFEKIADYLPAMNNVVWSIHSGKKMIGFIMMDENLQASFEFCEKNQPFIKMGITRLHCGYFHMGSFSYEGCTEEKPTSLSELLECVKRQSKLDFQDEVQVEGGSLCFWGEWVGRSHDNYYKIESVKWRTDELIIKFQEGESLYITNPSKIINEQGRLIIKDATKILFVWNSYGKEKSYETLQVLQYVKEQDGGMRRAKGKRRDIRDEDGTRFQPLLQQALCIE